MWHTLVVAYHGRGIIRRGIVVVFVMALLWHSLWHRCGIRCGIVVAFVVASSWHSSWHHSIIPKKHIFSLTQHAYTTVSDVQPSGPRIHSPNTNINLAHTPAFPLTVGLAPVRHIAPSDIHANPRRTAEESLKKVLAVFPMDGIGCNCSPFLLPQHRFQKDIPSTWSLEWARTRHKRSDSSEHDTEFSDSVSPWLV
jgi:hypothetical protein